MNFETKFGSSGCEEVIEMEKKRGINKKDKRKRYENWDLKKKEKPKNIKIQKK